MNKLLEVALIVAGGAAGGLLSVVDSWSDPVSYPLTMSKLAALLLIPVLKGGAAAGIGVYLLTTFDSTQLIRGFFFAVTCGLAFPSILTNSAGYAKKVTTEVANKSISENVDRINAAGKNTTGPVLSASAVAEIRDASVAIAQATPKVDPAAAKAADLVVQQAVSDIAKASMATNSDKTIEAISQIGGAAAFQNLPGSADKAVQELGTIRDAPFTSEPAKAKASIEIERIRRAIDKAPK